MNTYTQTYRENSIHTHTHTEKTYPPSSPNSPKHHPTNTHTNLYSAPVPHTTIVFRLDDTNLLQLCNTLHQSIYLQQRILLHHWSKPTFYSPKMDPFSVDFCMLSFLIHTFSILLRFTNIYLTPKNHRCLFHWLFHIFHPKTIIHTIIRFHFKPVDVIISHLSIPFLLCTIYYISSLLLSVFVLSGLRAFLACIDCVQFFEYI